MEITEGKLKEILENQRKEYQDYIFNLRKKIAKDTEKNKNEIIEVRPPQFSMMNLKPWKREFYF